MSFNFRVKASAHGHWYIRHNALSEHVTFQEVVDGYIELYRIAEDIYGHHVSFDTVEENLKYIKEKHDKPNNGLNDMIYAFEYLNRKIAEKMEHSQYDVMTAIDTVEGILVEQKIDNHKLFLLVKFLRTFQSVGEL